MEDKVKCESDDSERGVPQNECGEWQKSEKKTIE